MNPASREFFVSRLSRPGRTVPFEVPGWQGRLHCLNGNGRWGSSPLPSPICRRFLPGWHSTHGLCPEWEPEPSSGEGRYSPREVATVGQETSRCSEWLPCCLGGFWASSQLSTPIIQSWTWSSIHLTHDSAVVSPSPTSRLLSNLSPSPARHTPTRRSRTTFPQSPAPQSGSQSPDLSYAVYFTLSRAASTTPRSITESNNHQILLEALSLPSSSIRLHF
jgi:hypothetical protein